MNTSLTLKMFDKAVALLPKPPPPLHMPGGQLTRREAAELARMAPASKCLHCGGPCTVREIYCAPCWAVLRVKFPALIKP